MPDLDPKYQEGDPASADAVDAGVIISPDTRRPQRLPPGQSRTRKWPVLDAHGPPQVSLDRWRLRVFGAVARPLEYTWEQFRALPRVKVFSDFHCVTRWSRLGNLWEGVATQLVLEESQPLAEARFVILHGLDQGWTTNLPLADFAASDAVLAMEHDGAPLDLAHGGPVRAIVPQLYAWKSAKWLCGIELAAQDRPGYWEQGGYHNHGDPWREQRFQ